MTEDYDRDKDWKIGRLRLIFSLNPLQGLDSGNTFRDL
jgi:hypothetical protein